MNIAIAGYGVEGKASYEYWNAKPDTHVTLVDERPIVDAPADAAIISGEGAFARLNGFDVVVRTAGLAPHKITTDGQIWSATNEFFKQCPAPIIGVTGTKGKGTTSSLIEAMMRASGRKTHLLGNIGVPALSVLPTIQPDDIVIFELSSYQLWDLQSSPSVAVILLIEPDHLNVHRDMDDYVSAKAHIVQYQQSSDVVVYNAANHYAQDIAKASQAKKVAYGTDARSEAYADDTTFFYEGAPVGSLDELRLIGRHNVENACAAIAAVKQLGVSNEAIIAGLHDFSGLPHRIEFVRSVNGVRYYNDSFSSAPSASVAAVKSFTEPEIIILGGIDKGADFSELSATLRSASNIKEIVVIGEIKESLATILHDNGVSAPLTILDASTMQEVVTYVHSRAESGDVVLLSPGCASFDMFKDFYDRGDQFRALVQGL